LTSDEGDFDVINPLREKLAMCFVFKREKGKRRDCTYNLVSTEGLDGISTPDVLWVELSDVDVSAILLARRGKDRYLDGTY